MIKITLTATVSKTKAAHTRPFVYFFHQADDMGHNVLWRQGRPYQLYFDLLPAILRSAGVKVTDEDAQQPLNLGTWNRHAACPCGCSPAIVLERHGLHDLYVMIALHSETLDAGDTSDDT